MVAEPLTAADGSRLAAPLHCAILGVGPGLGASLARVFAAAGHDLSLLSRTLDTADRLVSELAGGVSVRADTLDLADEEHLRVGLRAAESALGPVAVLVVNGASYSSGRAREVRAGQLAADFATNVIGATVACQAVLPAMLAAGRGTILLTGGGAALYPAADTPALSITKAGLRAYAYSLHDDLRGTGVHATTITIEGGIGSRPHFAPDLIARTYLDAHLQDPSTWAAEIEYRDPVPAG